MANEYSRQGKSQTRTLAAENTKQGCRTPRTIPATSKCGVPERDFSDVIQEKENTHAHRHTPQQELKHSSLQILLKK